MPLHPGIQGDSNAKYTSFFTELECSGCGEKFSSDEIHTFCPNCQSPLLPRYDLKGVRRHVDRDAVLHRPKGMWRWQELLPVKDPENIVFLGEGDTALLQLPHVGKRLGLENLYVKDESSNPTGSFKARGTGGGGVEGKGIGH